MRKGLPYIIAAVAFLLLAVLFISSTRNKSRKLNEHISLRQKEKIPYGTFAAYHFLPSLFPEAAVSFQKEVPGYWMGIDDEKSDQAVFLMTNFFNADEVELHRLMKFVEKGNYVYIISRNLSEEATSFFGCSVGSNYFETDEDSLQLQLTQPLFPSGKKYLYPGKKYESFFSDVDNERTLILGRNENNTANFIQLKKGKGSFFIHMAPLAFSNYFILHKNNIEYFQQAVSVVPQTVKEVVWDEYYLSKPARRNEEEPGLFRVLFKYPEFKWALITAIFTLLLFVLLEMRRKQRMIPVWQRPLNDSLDFVKTIGRLYYDKRDHRNLAKKMATYFLDHVRSKYKLSSQEMDDAFIDALYHKTGYPVSDINNIIAFVKRLEEKTNITEEQLINFHKQLESFYQKT